MSERCGPDLVIGARALTRRPSQMESNPQAWLVSINGFLLDARGLPEDLQAECVARGLIPYLPGTR